MSRQQFGVDNWFSGAKQSQHLKVTEEQLNQAQSEIQRLKSEIEQLRKQPTLSNEIETSVMSLREQLITESGMHLIPIEQIKPNPNQPRQTFLEESIESMSRSLDQEGQLQPLILIEEEDSYLIIDGERRWRGASLLGWETLKAVIIPKPIDIHRNALLTSLHREDLNPLDKAEAIVYQIEKQTSLNKKEIPRILSTVIRRLNKQKQMHLVIALMTASESQIQQQLQKQQLNPTEQAILSVLLELQLNPASVDANIFPMLTLAEDLKQSIREFGLKGVQAMALQTLNAKNLAVSNEKAKLIRKEATKKVLNENLSALQTRKLVKEIRDQYGQNPSFNPTLETIITQIKKLDQTHLIEANPEQLQQFKNLLKEKLFEIEMLFKKT